MLLDEFTKKLIDLYQHHLPICSEPYKEMAKIMGCSETEILSCLQKLQEREIISRVGPVFAHEKRGASTLVALAVPAEDLEKIAAYINTLPEVNHNYQRTHLYNLWFVLTAPSQAHIDYVLHQISEKTGLDPLDLPMIKPYKIDLGFALYHNSRMPI
ncbi:Lrp/AsnC family transcriptional regulator [Ignatzschineria sp. LJL83]